MRRKWWWLRGWFVLAGRGQLRRAKNLPIKSIGIECGELFLLEGLV
jgi:hypothetical protein